jgi:hypothetical protein
MDPVTAFGLAGTVLDFTCFAWGLISGGKQIYQSANGTVTENESLTVVISDLNRIAEDLCRGSNPRTRAELAVTDLAEDCKSESDKLLVSSTPPGI